MNIWDLYKAERSAELRAERAREAAKITAREEAARAAAEQRRLEAGALEHLRAILDAAGPLGFGVPIGLGAALSAAQTFLDGEDS